jgi:tetratricopeptide (TPR) repeat protein
MAWDATADVLAILTLNLEMYPESWQTHLYFGQVHLQSGDKEAAIASYEKAYAINPTPWIQQQLDQAKSQ